MTHLRDTVTDRQERTAKYRNWDADARPESPLDAATDSSPSHETAYRDLIQKDPTICDTCFTYRYDVTAVEWWRGTFGWSDYTTWDARRETAVPLPADESASQGMRLACANCGTRGGIQHRPIPKAKVDAYTANLSDTLVRLSIEHAPELLHRQVRARNTSANQSRQDTHVFGPAVAAALRAVQPDPPAALYTRGANDA